MANETRTPDYMLVTDEGDYPLEDYITGTGQYILVHNRDQCAGQTCCIHNPSLHHMRFCPTNWRQDRGLMERICIHGVGHPDPDDLAFKTKFMDAKRLHAEEVHGCCEAGCCSPPKEWATMSEADREGYARWLGQQP